MIVVADTTPLQYLILIQHEHVLPALYGRVLVPPAVIDELSRDRTPKSVREWLTVLADASQHGFADLGTALDRLRQTNFRASEELFRWLLRQSKPQSDR